MKYKMVCIDMDGTLLGKGKKISDESKEAIKRVHDKGVEVVVTTGRIYNNAAYYSHLIGVKSPVIAVNGGIVMEKNTSEVIYENPIETEDCIKLVKLLCEMKFYFHFYTLDTVYSSDLFSEVITKIYMTKQVGHEHLKINYKLVKNLDEWEKLFREKHGKINKCIVFSFDPKKVVELREKLKEHKGLTCFGAGSRNLEINSVGVSKGNAVKALASYYGFKREEIVCIGDNENDLSMVEYAGLGIAMGNAIDELKSIADYITDTNKNHGVAKALNKFF